MSSKIAHSIKQRNKANDIFITPIDLAKKHIDMIEFNENDKWLDPCKNNGSYYNNFPNDNKDYCEILEQKDFFEYKRHVDIIIQNPPYSLMNKWIEKNTTTPIKRNGKMAKHPCTFKILKELTFSGEF